MKMKKRHKELNTWYKICKETKQKDEKINYKLN